MSQFSIFGPYVQLALGLMGNCFFFLIIFKNFQTFNQTNFRLEILLHLGVPNNQILLCFGVPDNQTLLHLGVPDNCSSCPGMARRIYSLSSCWGHQNGVKFGCQGHRNNLLLLFVLLLYGFLSQFYREKGGVSPKKIYIKKILQKFNVV